MAGRLFQFRRPESEQEIRHYYYGLRHKCGPAIERWRRGVDPNDEVVFAVGVYGREMPLDVPFEMATTEECGACGLLLRAWGVWRGDTIIDLGAK